jgi:uncharacterized protein (TIGR02217 family)
VIDDVRLPERWSRGSSSGAAFLTIAVPLASGEVDRAERWEDPLSQYDIAHNIKSLEEMAELRAFHKARRGASRGFLIKDWVEFTSASDGVSDPDAEDQPLGTGDGATTVFSIVKRYADAGGSYDQPIAWPVAGTVLVAVDGAPLGSGFTVQRGDGTITFAVAPALDAVLTCGFEFDVPVRFVDDMLPVLYDNAGQRSASQIALEEVRS